MVVKMKNSPNEESKNESDNIDSSPDFRRNKNFQNRESSNSLIKRRTSRTTELATIEESLGK
jgi:hypothetical protein